MIQYLTECKTDKTIVHKIEWSSGRQSNFEQTYKSGEKTLHKTKKQAIEYIDRMKVHGIDIVFIGKHISIHRKAA